MERFGSPFGYRLKRVEGGDAPARTVDLVESLVYLLGLDVNRLYREPAGVVLTGGNRRGQSAAVFFRDVEQDDSTQWLTAIKLSRHTGMDRRFPDCRDAPKPAPSLEPGFRRSMPERRCFVNLMAVTQWLQTKLAEYPADHVYTNNAAALSFQGCERFEAIEAVFALQFGRV